MKLKFYINPKSPSDQLLINKAKNLGLRLNFIKKFNIKRGDRFHIAIDEDEKKPASNIYLIPCDKDDLTGLLVSFINKQHFINFNGVCNLLDVKPPCKCDYEKFEEGEYKGIKITVIR